MDIIIIIVWLGTSILVAFDAKKNQITSSDKPYSTNNGALAWFFLCVVVWIIAFPYYLLRRRKIMRLRNE
jgi:hypothetical protein